MDFEEDVKIYFNWGQGDKFSELEKDNIYQKYLKQGVALPKPDFMICVEESDHKTVNKLEDIPLTNFKEEDLLPDNLGINDATIKEEVTEILISDTKEYCDLIVKKEVESSCDCNFCSLGFSSKKYLKKHLALCLHKDSEEYSSEGMLHCPVCDIYFTNGKYLESHLEYCGDNLKAQERVDGNTDTDMLSIKKKSINDDKEPFQRTISRHNVEKLFYCTICNKKFTAKSTLNAHLNIHAGVKPYECTTCNKKFSKSGHLKIHLRIHTGEKPYECTVCNKKFTNSSDLKRHLNIHSAKKTF